MQSDSDEARVEGPPGEGIRAASMSQAGLDEHFRTFFKSQATDFRASAISAFVLRRLDRSANVLDLGCGSCVLTHLLLKEGVRVVSVDPSAEMISMAREFLGENGFSGAELHQLDIDGCVARHRGKFDQVVCLDVIEHIRDDSAAVAGIAALQKPGGRLLLSVPAIPALYGPKDVRVGHYRRYSRRALVEMLERQGYEVRDCRYWNSLGVPVTWLFVKLFRREVNESVRRTKRGAFKRFVNAVLRWWFRVVENNLRPPLGLTLLVEAVRKPAD